MRLSLGVCLFALVGGCAGTRLVAPGAYNKVELRDVAPLGLEDQNIEVVAPIGAIGSSDHCDLLKIPLQAPLALNDHFGAQLGGAFANIVDKTFHGMLSDSDLTITLPRSRYAEVRDLPPHALVRVRGYISRWLGAGCDRELAGHARALWVDTLESVSAPQP